MSVLQNSAKIRPSINFGQNATDIRTKDGNGALSAVFKIDTAFPRDFCIYDLNQFNSVLSLFNEPEIEFLDTHMIIHGNEGKSRINYAYTNEILITAGQPEKLANYNTEIVLQNKICSFTLTNATFKELTTAASLFGIDDLIISEHNPTQIRIEATTVSKTKKDTDNSYTTVLDVVVKDVNEFKSLQIVTMKSILKLIPNDYVVSIYKMNDELYMIEFNAYNDKIRYFAVAMPLEMWRN